MASGDLITRTYKDFLGVDFSDFNVSYYRSPDSLNMWKDYAKLGKCLSTRPALKKFKGMNNKVFGMFPYRYGGQQHMIIHCGVSLYDYNMETKDIKTLKQQGMNTKQSKSFIYGTTFYIKDGINYLQYDGSIIKEVETFTPATSISRKPEGGGVDYQGINMLSPLRKNEFVADSVSTVYYLDANEIDYVDVIYVDGKEIPTTDYTVNKLNGSVTFKTAPTAPDTDGEDNVIITFSKKIAGYADRIKKCTLLEIFDNRVFFSGNEDYPNTLWHCELNNPGYVIDQRYITDGMDAIPIRAMISANNALWVFKEPSQANTTVYYHTPSTGIDNAGQEIISYPSTHSSISTGCVSTAVNFNDDICVFSDYGLEGITGDLASEQFLSHRSSMIDAKLLSEDNYRKPITAEWKGYLLVFIDNRVYLADSRQKWTNVDHNEYEWYYWELEKRVLSAGVIEGNLYIGTEDGIYEFEKGSANVESYWSTARDEFESPNYQKITNKKGCTCDVNGNIEIYAKVDNEDWNFISKYNNTKSYIVPRIKKKKWRKIQFKFCGESKEDSEGNKIYEPFDLYTFTIQCYIGSYVKR